MCYEGGGLAEWFTTLYATREGLAEWFTTQYAIWEGLAEWFTTTLYAMREGLAEWFNTFFFHLLLYGHSTMDMEMFYYNFTDQYMFFQEDFFEQLETGVVLCQHANNVQSFILDRLDEQRNGLYIGRRPLPQVRLISTYLESAKAFVCQLNVSEFFNCEFILSYSRKFQSHSYISNIKYDYLFQKQNNMLFIVLTLELQAKTTLTIFYG